MNYYEMACRLLQLRLNHPTTAVDLALDPLISGSGRELYYLYKADHVVYPTELCKVFNQPTSRVSTVLNQLEKDGLVIRKPDLQDKRKIQIVITEQGKKEAGIRYDDALRGLEMILKNLGEEKAAELLALNEALCKVDDSIERRQQ